MKEIIVFIQNSLFHLVPSNARFLKKINMMTPNFFCVWSYNQTAVTNYKIKTFKKFVRKYLLFNDLNVQ